MDEVESQDVALENNADAETDTKDESKDTDWKAEAAKWKRIANQKAKKAEPKSDDAPKKEETTKDPSELDYGQRALLRSLGIKGPDETQLAKDYLKRTGQDIDSLESDDIFQARLEKLRTTKANELAAEGKSGRSGNNASGKNSVEYWLAKGEHPPAELGKELAQQYVDARRSKGKTTKVFYND